MWTKHENQWGVFYHFLTQDLAYLIGVVNANPWQPAFQHNPGSLWLNLIPWVGNASGMPVLLQALQFVRRQSYNHMCKQCYRNLSRIAQRVRHCFSDLVVFPQVFAVFCSCHNRWHFPIVGWTDATRCLCSVGPKNTICTPRLADCAFEKVKAQPLTTSIQ